MTKFCCVGGRKFDAGWRSLLLYLLTSRTLSVEILFRSLIFRDLPKRNVGVGFSLKFAYRLVSPRTKILTQAKLSMARLLVQL